MSDDPEQSALFLLGRLANEQEANRKLRVLLTRAADVLEEQARVYPGMQDSTSSLIAELHQAAK